jgi:TolA-binding protein
MTMQCTAPALQEHLFDWARGATTFIALEPRRHLDECEDCRASVERLRRLAGTWRALRPTSEETSAARARFAFRARRRAQGASFKIIAVAVLLASAAASAAGRVVLGHWPTRATFWPIATTPVAKGHILASAPRSSPAVPAPLSAPMERDPDAAEPLASPRAGASPSEPRRPPSLAPRKTKLHSAPSRPPFDGDPVAVAWKSAASALRSGDYRQAEMAFNTLASCHDAGTRDAARLARAQIWVAEGRYDDARPELDALSASGATAYIRGRAVEALKTIP